jgi:sugar phosphate isomerase/epimerase
MSANDPNLLANCWTHPGDVDPFPGAHGHRAWSSWSMESRAANLSKAGFDAIGLHQDDLMHVLDVEFGEEGDREAALERLNTVITENGIDTVELEFLTEWVHEEGDPRRAQEQEVRELLLMAADILDAKHIKVGNLSGYTIPTEQLKETFDDIAGDFEETDTAVGFELFPADPNVDTLDDALAIVEKADNGGLFLDIWHMVKMGISYEDIGNLDSDDITAIEFNDGYVDTEMGFMEETVNLRKIPGEGEFDIQGFIDAVKSTGFDGPWGLEILSEEYRRLSMNDAYSRAYEGGAQYL